MQSKKGCRKRSHLHSLTGLNVIIFYDGLFNNSYYHYNQQEKLENNYKTSFWKSQHCFKKSERTHMLEPPSPCLFLSAFQWPPSPPLHTFSMTPKIIQVWSTILVIIFWDILMFDKIFVSPKVKRMVIITNKHGIYELSHELPNDLRLRTLENSEISRRSQIFIEL